MAYGKGSFTIQDKVLPGIYVNVKGEADVGSTLGSRGKVAVALDLDWGMDTGDIVKITAKQFYSECNKLFGYNYYDAKMQILREIFKGASEVYVYRLNGDYLADDSPAAKSSSANFANAKYAGVRGNDLKIVVSASIDHEGKYDVVTYLADMIVDRQVGVDENSLKDNDFVTFLKDDGFTLGAGSKVLSGGANSKVSGGAHNDFLIKLEAYQVNVVGCVYETEGLSEIYASWVKNQRDIYGNCIQAVLYNQPADHEGIINVDDSIAMVPWVMGKSAGCELNASLQNVVYDGEVKPVKSYTQFELETALKAGKFVLHRVGDTYRVLADINSLVSISGDKTEDLKMNQQIRVIDQINIDTSEVWVNAFLGKVPNNKSGRISFWSRIITLLNEYVSMGAIEEFDSEEVTVDEGTQRGSVVVMIPVQVATMLEKAYVTIVVQ